MAHEHPSRELPGHIAAALAGAGGSTDSAGQPWAGRNLPAGESYHNFDDDDGSQDPAYAAALDALAAGTGTEAGVVAALAQARVFVPIVAQLAEAVVGPDGLASDKESDMALVTLQAPDGRTTLPVFSSAQALSDWHAEARPVAVYAARAALSAVSEQADLVVLDPGSARPFVLRRPAVWALAQQQEWVPSYADPEVAAALAQSKELVGDPALLSIAGTASTGIQTIWDNVMDPNGTAVQGGGAGPELVVDLTLAPGLDQAAVQHLLERLQGHWSTNDGFAQRVDSIQIRLTASEPATTPQHLKP
ncbi:SseB family protein [Arthrobacter sp. 35W]|uniref:SseB family protein n=1 Tax=Arthrobacter sp. 35W TaxID=1132441 RepID=UPI0003F53A75|nr:SseB family protein [Arthrobacter sp. 35W]